MPDAALGYREEDVEGTGTIMFDAVIVYKAESYTGDTLEVAVTAGDFTRLGCDLFYRITNIKTGVEVARAKTAIGFFDYKSRKIRAVPEGFQRKWKAQLAEAGKTIVRHPKLTGGQNSCR